MCSISRFDQKVAAITVDVYSFWVQNGTPGGAVAIASGHETWNITFFAARFTSKVVRKHVLITGFDVKLAANRVDVYSFGPQMLPYKHICCT